MDSSLESIFKCLLSIMQTFLFVELTSVLSTHPPQLPDKHSLVSETILTKWDKAPPWLCLCCNPHTFDTSVLCHRQLSTRGVKVNQPQKHLPPSLPGCFYLQIRKVVKQKDKLVAQGVEYDSEYMWQTNIKCSVCPHWPYPSSLSHTVIMRSDGWVVLTLSYSEAYIVLSFDSLWFKLHIYTNPTKMSCLLLI